MKKIIITTLACVALCGCAGKTISTSQYVDAMTALGCKDLMEGNPAADEVLKQNGVTSDQVQEFRKKTDFKVIAEAAAEIAKRVMACHGVSQ